MRRVGPALGVALLSLVALWFRLEYVSRTEIEDPIRADARQYAIYGYNLATHGVFSQTPPGAGAVVPDSYRSPGYPALVAATFLLSGDDFYRSLLRVQAGIGALTVVLAFLVARRLLTQWLAVAVAGLVAFSPHLISMTVYALTETLFALLLCAAVWIVLEMRSAQPARWMPLAAGALFGLAYLTNETAGFIPFAVFGLVGLLEWRSNGWRSLSRSLLPWAVCVAVFSLAPLLWIARNHASVPPGASTGSSRALQALSHGAYPGFVYESEEFKYTPYKEDPEQLRFSSSLKDFAEIFRERAAERPLRYLNWYLFEKPFILWTWNILQGEGDVYVYSRGPSGSLYDQSAIAAMTKTAMRWLHPILMSFLALAPIALAVEAARNRTRFFARVDQALIILTILAGYTALYTVFCPWPRYAIPLRPLFFAISLWSAQALVGGILEVRSRSRKRA